MTKKAIFLDRDGTLVEEVGYLKMIEDLRFTPRAREALRIFQSLGYLNIVITNQSAVARGILSPKELKKLHTKLKSLAAEDGATIHDIFVCPHLAAPAGRVAPYNIDCNCRKPAPGLIQQAAKKHHLDLNACLIVGDKRLDLELAQNAGVRSCLVLTGYGAQTREEWSGELSVVSNLYELAKQMEKEEADKALQQKQQMNMPEPPDTNEKTGEDNITKND